MFSKEKSHKVTVEGVAKQQIWQVWQDVNSWHTWDQDIEWARLIEPFATGSTFELKPRSGPKVKIELSHVINEKSFTDFCRFPLARMYSVHEMRTTNEGLEIVHVVRVEGFLAHLWWKLVGKNVAAGMPEQTEAMIARAKGVYG